MTTVTSIDFNLPGDFLAKGRVNGSGTNPPTGRYAFRLDELRVSGNSDKHGSRFVNPRCSFVDDPGAYAAEANNDAGLRWPYTDDGDFTPEIIKWYDEDEDKCNNYLGALASEWVTFLAAFDADEVEDAKVGGYDYTKLVGQVCYGEYHEPLAASAPEGYPVEKNHKFGRIIRWLSQEMAERLDAAEVPVVDNRVRPWGDAYVDNAPRKVAAQLPPENVPAASQTETAGLAARPAAAASLPTAARKPKKIGLTGKAK